MADWADMQSPTFRDYAATQGRYQQSGRSLINIGESEVIGIEAMGIYAVNGNLELTLHFGWKDSERTSAGTTSGCRCPAQPAVSSTPSSAIGPRTRSWGNCGPT